MRNPRDLRNAPDAAPDRPVTPSQTTTATRIAFEHVIYGAVLGWYLAARRP